ncbi:MAG TPA: DNA-formamidopyrimidine glycosylase family protein [Candidatus Sulfotelmatobacter sp.]|nr:DNA-formamidopyrimidine glycosylase family protein [Candidatus Sulfotelmatobacter sp.]
MPELPDIEVYLSALRARIEGDTLERVRLVSPFLLRTVSPSPQDAEGRRVTRLRRLGKRIVIGLDGGILLVLHLMIAGRLHWKPKGTKLAGKLALAAFDFGGGTLTLTEAGSKKRASLHIVRGEEGLAALDPGGLEPLEATLEAFRSTLVRENRTLKRALTDPTIFSGIGNAYSDEILWAAKLSPAQLTRNLDDAEITRLRDAVQKTLRDWRDRLGRESGDGFPEKVTAFREEMAVHGRYRKACPACGSPVQRIVYAENEANYCARCQTGGRLLADRALSRLLGKDWPKTLEELERR